MARTPIDKENRVSDPRNNRNAIVDRRQFQSQLYDANGNPTRVMYEFCGRMQKEAGDLGPEGRMAWAETVFNRCASRGHTIDYELRNHGRYSYWPKSQPEPGYIKNQEYIDTINKVCNNGTNLTLGATGNASLGVGVGRVTHKVKYERFGVENGDSNWWNNKFGSLIRGVGKFIGDIAGAIGQVVGAVAKGVVEVGKWVFNGIGSLFSPHAQTPPHPPAHLPVHAPPHAPLGHPQVAQPPHPQINRQPELRPQIKHQDLGGWRYNAALATAPTRTTAAEPKVEPRPRP